MLFVRLTEAERRSRYTYAFGYKSVSDATERLCDFCAAGEISEGEQPHIERYMTNSGFRWCITLLHC